MKLINGLFKIMCVILILPTSVLAVSVKQIKLNHNSSMAESLKAKNLEQLEIARRVQADLLNTPPEKFFNNYFQELRKKVTQSSREKQMLAVEADKISMKEKMTNNLFLDTTIKFIPESFTFFIAIGAVNYMSMVENAGANPLLLEQHLESAKDPIGHLSFLMFMQTNAAYSAWRMKKVNAQPMTIEQRSFAMRSINYEGMSAGSFVSGVSADIMTLVKDCAHKLKSVPSNAKEQQIADQTCNQALIQWTLSKKTNQYLASIAALVGVQAATEFIHGGAAHVSSGLLKLLKADGAKKVFKTASIDVAFILLPGKFALKSIKFLGHITQVGFFIAVDHWLNATVTRGFNNIYKNWDYTSFLKQNLKHNLDINFEAGSAYGWNLDLIKNHKPIVPTRENLARVNSQSAVPFINIRDFGNEFILNLKSFGESQADWRAHLNINLEQDLSGWTAETMKLVNQVHLSEDYYTRFLSELLDYSKVYYRTKLPQEDLNFLPETAWNKTTGFPYRKLPLFGIKYIPWEEKQGKLTQVTEGDAYLLFPSETEKAQSQFLVKVADYFLNTIKVENLNLNSQHEKIMSDFFLLLMQNDPIVQGRALSQFAKLTIVSQDESSARFIKLRASIFNEIGTINSQMMPGAGFNEAFELNRNDKIQAARFSDLNSIRGSTSIYSFGSLMMYQMICGGPTASVKNYIIPYLNAQYASSNFIPPRLANFEIGNQFCDQKVLDEDMFKSSILLKDKNGILKQQTPLEAIINNLNSQVFADYRNNKSSVDLSKWWTQNALIPISDKLAEFDKGYQELIQKLDTNLFGTNRVDYATQSENSLLSGNIRDSYRFETHFYLNTLNLILNKSKLDLPTHGKNSFISEIHKISKNRKPDVLPQIKNKTLNAVKISLNKLLSELEKPTYQIPSEFQNLSEADLEQLKLSHSDLSFLKDNLNYQTYYELKQSYLKSLTDVEVLFGLNTEKQTESTDQNGNSTLTVEQTVAQLVVLNLRQMESDISRFVQMKLLNKYGLKFSEKDSAAMMSEAAKKSCVRTATGCK